MIRIYELFLNYRNKNQYFNKIDLLIFNLNQ